MSMYDVTPGESLGVAAARGSQEVNVFRSMMLRWVAGNVAIAAAVAVIVVAVTLTRGNSLTDHDLVRSLVGAGEFSAFMTVIGAGAIGVVASFGLPRRSGLAGVALALTAMALLYIVRIMPLILG